MVESNNVIEYGPGDITYIGASYKLSEPESPIVEMWTKHYNELSNWLEDNKKTRKKISIILWANVGLAVTNLVIFSNPIINTIVYGVCGLGLLKSGRDFYKFGKRDKFKLAITYFPELKKYEELYPEEKSIINNPNLKGVSKRKILKRKNAITHHMY